MTKGVCPPPWVRNKQLFITAWGFFNFLNDVRFPVWRNPRQPPSTAVNPTNASDKTWYKLWQKAPFSREKGVSEWPKDTSIDEGFKLNRRQRSSLFFGGPHLFNSLPRKLFSTRTIWRIGRINPFLHIILGQIILFFISSWCKIASAVRNWINSVPQITVTTFAFCSV